MQKNLNNPHPRMQGLAPSTMRSKKRTIQCQENFDKCKNNLNHCTLAAIFQNQSMNI